MSPGRIVALVAAALLVAGALLRRKRLGHERFIGALVIAAILVVYGSHVLAHVDIQKGIENLANALGKWTYALVGFMAFAETGAFIGLIAPGEFTILLGGVIAGQGTINIYILIGLVWACTLMGDSLSFLLGGRLGRRFLVKHGPKFRITPERLAQVDEHFRRRGGATVLVGRFIGFVRPLAPFIAGASGMRYRRFIPYSIVGTGIWGPGLCVIGYVSYRSFSKVSKIVGQATLVFGTTVAVLVGIWYAHKRLKDPAERARLAAWLERQGKRPLLRPLAAVLRPLWRRVLRPTWNFVMPQLRFIGHRLTPGQLGIEFTTSVAMVGVGLYVFIAYLVHISSNPGPTPADQSIMDLADDTQMNTLVDVVKVFTHLGTLAVVGTLVGISALLLAMRRRPVELICLVAGLVLIVIAVNVTKAAVDRPRPPDELVHANGSSFPSAHAAYSVAYVAMAVIAARVLPGLGSRAALVLVSVIGAAAIGLSRIYLHVHWWSDVVSGWGLGAAIFGICAATALVVVHVRNTWQAQRV
jgi:membrane protein DedA with SNARE-associated domain/membrane-associated phospholipid phosphatase